MNAAALLAILAIGPTSTAAADGLAPSRPFGNVLGDGLRLTTEPDAPTGGVCAPGETQYGIDVSYYQGDIDWAAVAASGVTFAIVRVSHSTQFFDPQFDANLAGARAAGIHTGVYQYFQPDEDGATQAQFLLDHLGELQPGDLPPMIDVETTGGQSGPAIADAIHAWIDTVEAALGVKPMIYTGFYFWNDNVGSADFGDYPLIVAWYGVDCPGGVPTGWDMWTMHQFSSTGSVPGIAGDVDEDRFNGTLADLDALASSPECGDAMCTGGETAYTCAGDCPPCGVIPAAGGTLDNGDACYSLYGDSQYWHEEAAGEGGSLVWTHATNYDQAYNYAIWQLHFEESGQYEIEVHITQPYGQSTLATYDIRHSAGDSSVLIDQAANDGWVSLGEFEFEAATDHTVRLDDNTGDAPEGMVQLAYDALRVTRLDLDPTSGGAETSGTEGDEEEDSEGGNGNESSSGIGPETSGSATDDTFGPALPGLNDDAGGCGCRAAHDRSGWLLLFGMLSACGLLRGRGRRSST